MGTYEKTAWVNNSAPALNATNLNKIENQLYASDLGSNVKIVHSDETIQAVIDICPVASGNLKDGFTNPYVIKVPPGHEKEYYSLVRNASDAASDKRNVKVVFEDNPEGKFISDLYSNCETLSDWTVFNATNTLDSEYQFIGSHCIKLINSGASDITFQRTGVSLDLREYQGVLIDVNINSAEYTAVKFRAMDADVNYTYCVNSLTGLGQLNGSIYFPFKPYSTTYPDFSAITTLKFSFTPASAIQKPLYVDNIRLIRTFPASVAIMRFDDNYDDHWKYIDELDDRGWKGCFLCRGNYIDLAGNLTNDQLKRMNANEHSIINHTMSHIMPFNEISDEVANYETMANYNWQILNGFKRGFPFFVAPGGVAQPESMRCVNRQGGMSLYNSQSAFPSDIIAVSSPSFPTTDLAKFIGSQRGGVVQAMIHQIPDADIAAYRTMVEYIEANFSYVISVDDIPKLFSNDWPVKFEPNFSLYDCGRTETLTGNITIKPYEGKTFSFDPGGAARSITPIAKIGTVYQLGHEIILVNTADAAESLTFDSTFTVAGAHDGDANVDTLTDSGEAWTEGQLIGRTLNNTTDGSSGTITANDGTTVTATLSGGTDNDWDIGDTYTITPAGLNQAIAQNERGIFTYDGSGWQKIFVG